VPAASKRRRRRHQRELERRENKNEKENEEVYGDFMRTLLLFKGKKKHESIF
jgi:hypothetical protein